MISSATLFLATLAFHVLAVLGAPIGIPAGEIVYRSLGNPGSSVRFAREDIFPSPVPAIVARAVADVFPVVKRDTEDIVRRYPRRFIQDYLEKRGTTVTEKVIVSEKVIEHDTPEDTVAYNNGQPHNDANNGVSGFTTTIGFSTTITVPGVPTPTTVTATVTATTTPTATATANPNAGSTGGDATDGANKPTGTTTAAGPAPTDATTDGTNKPADGNAKPTDGTTKPADGTTKTDDKTTTTDGNTDPNATTPTTTGGDSKTQPGDGTPGTDATTTTTPADGGNSTPADGTTRREIKPEASSQPIAKRQLATSGAAYASSLRRRAL